MLHCYVLYDGVTWRTLLCLHIKQNGSFCKKWFSRTFSFTSPLPWEERKTRSHLMWKLMCFAGEISCFDSCNTLLDFLVCWVSAMTLTTHKLVSHEQRPHECKVPSSQPVTVSWEVTRRSLVIPSACHKWSHCGLQLTGRFNTVTDADDGASDYSAVICYFTQLSCEWVRSEEGTYRPGSKIQKRVHTLEPKPELRLSSSPTQLHSAFLRHGSCDNYLDIKQLLTQNFFFFPHKFPEVKH